MLQIRRCLIPHTHVLMNTCLYVWTCICMYTLRKEKGMKNLQGVVLKSTTKWECQVSSLVYAHLKHSLYCSALYTCVYACLCVGVHTYFYLYIYCFTHFNLRYDVEKFMAENGRGNGNIESKKTADTQATRSSQETWKGTDSFTEEEGSFLFTLWYLIWPNSPMPICLLAVI